MRRPEYRIRTEQNRRDGEKVVRKVAGHPDAAPFLDTIFERERLADRFYADHAEVVSGRRIDDGLEYSYLPYPTLEQEIEARIRAGDPDRGGELVRSYIRFLEALPSKETVPRDFLESVGAPEIHCRCFVAGPLDCIPRNILVDARSWHVIDHEWMLEFPVPVDLVVYLGISSLVFGLQKSIRESVDAARPVAIFAGRRQRFFAPTAWLEVLGELRLPLDLLNDWYDRFQQQVLVDASPRVLRRTWRPFTRVPGRWHPLALLSDVDATLRPAGPMRLPKS